MKLDSYHKQSEKLLPEANITSKWGTGWRTPTFIIAMYLSALTIALTHLFLFQFLDGAASDGPKEKAPQAYINNASHLLASAFQLCLQASLGTSFIQYLWLILRQSVLQVSTIEALFLIRSAPFSIFKWTLLRKTPRLVCFACLIWAIYIVAIFPPGALTIGSAKHTTHINGTVPTFNASCMGNGSFIDANLYAFEALMGDSSGTNPGPQYSVLTSTTLFDGTGDQIFSSTLQHSAKSIIIDGKPLVIPSPCGPNCSYTTTFDGPHFKCNISTEQPTLWGRTDFQAIYTGNYMSAFSLDPEGYRELESNYYNSSAVFQSSSHTALASCNTTVVTRRQNLTCFPYRAQYVLNNNYENNTLSTTISVVPIQPIPSFDLDVLGVPQYQGLQLFPYNIVTSSSIPTPILQNSGFIGDATATLNWTSTGLERYRDLHLLDIIAAVSTSLAGPFYTSKASNLTACNTALIGNPYYFSQNESTQSGELWSQDDDLWSLDTVWDYSSNTKAGDQAVTSGPTTVSLIADSKLNDVIRLQLKDLENYVNFTITQDLLNELLQNVTISAITSYGFWNTTANITVHTMDNVYKFSSPLTLILPYFITLLVALPFIAIGLWALHTNGVPASDGGFIPLISTTISATLEREASIGCLGGKENIPDRLQTLEVRFGELIDRQGDHETADNRVVRRAGFGTEEETMVLKKGARYGRPSIVDIRAGWI